MTPEALHIQLQMAAITIKIRWTECILMPIWNLALQVQHKFYFNILKLCEMIWCIFQSHNKISPMIELEHSSVAVIERFE